MSVRLAVLADIHGNIIAFEAVLRHLRQYGGADKIWILGDLCAFGPRPVECLQLIRDLPQAEVISGNTDRYLVTGERAIIERPKDETAWQQFSESLRLREAALLWTISKLSFADYTYLADLRSELSLHVEDYGWLIGYHGAPGDDERVLMPDTPDDELLDQLLDREGRLGFGGHTHRPMDRSLDGWRVVNGGSVGLPQDLNYASYALAGFEGDRATIELRQVEFDMMAAANDMQQLGHPMWPRVMETLKNSGNNARPV